jgi:LuxR family transcriptional regulator, maltose regulon positive regulatory protein
VAGWDWVDTNWRLARPGTPVVPSLPRYYVPRPRLHRLLDHALDDAKVTLLRAPAVSGKSTLISGWHAEGGRLPMAYVSLDRLDNDPARFWDRVVRELELGGPGREVGAAEVASPTDARRLLRGHLPELVGRRRSVLVLDRVDLLTNEDVCQVLGEFLLDLPASLRVILSGRAEPAPSLRAGLLRARGQMAEIHAADLAFERGELEEFFAHFVDLELDEADLDALHERTEGWIGGVTLTGLALLRRPDRAASVHQLSGSSRYLAELLAAEVFDPEPAEVRRFMLATSVLDHMDGRLADVVTGGTGGAATLDRLERSGMFVEATDEQRTTFRYRSLFREFLRHRLRLLDPASESAAHQAAAREYQGRGDIGRAVAHHVGAEAPDDAIRLILAHGEEAAASGRVDDLRGWLAELPDRALTGDIRQLLRLCQMCVTLGMLDEARLWLERARWRLEGTDDPVLVAQHSLLVGHGYAVSGNLERALVDAHRVLLMDAGPSAQAEELRSRAHHLLASCHSALDQLDQARQHQHMAPPDPLGDLPTHAYSAWLAYRDGRLDHAVSYADDVLVMTRRPWHEAMPLVARGAVRRERHQLGEAEDDLQHGIAAARRWSRAGIEVLGAIELALLRLAQRREAEAFTALIEARPRAISAHLLQRVEVAEALLWLRAGDVERSRFGREELPDGSVTAELDVRLALAGRPLDDVPERLARFEAASQSLPERITAQLLRARLALAWDDDAGAERHLRTAVEWGRREQFVQRFAPDLPALEPVLRSLASGYDDAYPFSLLAAIADQGTGVAGATPAPAEFEPLSEREQIVLRYLPTGLSNKRIAAELHMSVNTLKTHLKSIYRKLGAGSRDESVAHARQLHLL